VTTAAVANSTVASAGRPIVAFAHARRSPSTDAIAVIGSVPYELVDVVVDTRLIDELAGHDPDVVVIDSRLAKFDVRRLCRDIRRSIGSRILVLAAPADAADETWAVQVIEAGADDVMPMPVSGELLRSHLLALVRSAPERRRGTATIVIGDVEVDVDGYAVFVAGRLVRFPRLQFKLLLSLARRPNKVVSFGQLLAEVWSVDPPTVNPRRVRVAASILRRLLGEGVMRPRVETVSRVGYRLIVPR
jgi:two-component system response regulator MtrA